MIASDDEDEEIDDYDDQEIPDEEMEYGDDDQDEAVNGHEDGMGYTDNSVDTDNDDDHAYVRDEEDDEDDNDESSDEGPFARQQKVTVTIRRSSRPRKTNSRFHEYASDIDGVSSEEEEEDDYEDNGRYTERSAKRTISTAKFPVISILTRNCRERAKSPQGRVQESGLQRGKELF